MTVESMSSLPLQAGGAVAAAAGRTAVWAISLYMRQPLRNTAVALLVGVSMLAGANALYKQAHHHPAPMFGSFESSPAVTKKAAPVLPAKRPSKPIAPVSDETTGSVEEPARALPTIGKDEVTAVQQKLQALGLFSGTVDGIFGPRTSKAIKAFEANAGRSPKGQLTPQTVAMIRDAEIHAPTPVAIRAPVAPIVQTVPATQQAVPTPAPVTLAKTELPALAPAPAAKPLPTPAPLLPAQSSQAPLAVAKTELPASPAPTESRLPTPAPLLPAAQSKPVSVEAQAPVQLAPPADDAASAIQVATAESEDATPQPQPLAMTQQNSVPKRSVQTIAVRATPAPAASAPAQAASVEQDAQLMPEQLAPATEGIDASKDPDVVAAVQRGLNSLGFLHAKVNGVADEATSKAIRNFEVYFNYDVTGRVTKQLVSLLEQNGAAT